jgi:hypothetical protein
MSAGIWMSLGCLYLALTFILSLTLGGLVVFTPYVSPLAVWMRATALYDLLPLGFAYAILMILVGIGFILPAIAESKKSWYTTGGSRFWYATGLLGSVIFIALLIIVFRFLFGLL